MDIISMALSEKEYNIVTHMTIAKQRQGKEIATRGQQ
jgi:hypothetical protein